jgi:4,5-DOPA dioxygenase extradiol
MATKTPFKMPTIFIGHGSPMNALEENRYTLVWRKLGDTLPRPSAVVCVSAHWFTRGTFVTAMQRPRTIHDFGGFPQALYAVEYPAPGSPALAARVRDLLQPVDVGMDEERWGLDHGTWSVLAHVFRQADIPVVQLSIDGTQSGRYHYELAQRLAPLRQEGVLILGSGNVVHNLQMASREPDASAAAWALRFNGTVREKLSIRDHHGLVEFDVLGQDASMSIPTPEHYLPLIYSIAQQDNSDDIAFLTDGIELGSISMLSIAIGLNRVSDPRR